MKDSKTKKLHITIIVLGIIFNCIGIFHSNLWFDEAYSVGLASKSFADIWTIGGNDVHPVLYYWILHIIYLIANNFSVSQNIIIIMYRIFSAICISLLGILGYTHIKKDFGEKIGILFSFFSYLLPIICIYTAEVRMYSLAILLVTILAIYAYRLAKFGSLQKAEYEIRKKHSQILEDKNKFKQTIKNWIIFGITSLLCIYTHYYALMAAGIINCILLVYLIKQKRKQDISIILILGIIQALLYIPWILCFMNQLKHVSKGFWIKFEFPKTLMQLLSSQFIGNLKEQIGFGFSIIIYIYLIYKVHKAKKDEEDCKPAIYSILIYSAVILAALIITAIMKTSILYYRYLFAITGLYIFFISYMLGKEKNINIIKAICGITLVLGIWSNYNQIMEVYDKTNNVPISYLKEKIQPDDVIVFKEASFGSGIVIGMNFEENEKIFYNPSDWGVKEAYKAFGNKLNVCTNTDFYQNLPNRIWIIDSPNEDYYNEMFNNDQYELISKNYIKTKYEDYEYNIILVEKVDGIVNDENVDNEVVNNEIVNNV